MTDQHLTQDEWEGLHLLSRDSGAAPGPYALRHLQDRGLVIGFELTELGKTLHTEFAARYQNREVRRNYIGKGRRTR